MSIQAIIPVAGWGSRRLPITKAIEKCMLPVGNRPLVDYVVQDCIAAGIRDIHFVVSEGSTQVQAYYGSNQALEAYLEQEGKTEYLPLIQPPDGIRFHYHIQPVGKYGTAVPVALVASTLPPDSQVVVLMGDDFVYHRDGTSEVARLLEAAGSESAMLGVEVPRESVSRYGVIEMDESHTFVRIVEKPTPEAAPSTLINVSKYVLSPAVLREIQRYVDQSDRSEEYYITDPINTYVAAGGRLQVLSSQGAYLDGGSVEGWLHANQVVLSES